MEAKESDSLPRIMAAGGSDDDDDDPGAYAAVLKRKLDLYCAAVAKSMEIKSQESSLGYPNSQASDTSQLISQASDTSLLISQASFHDNADSQGNTASTGILKEQSDDDDDDHLEEYTNPANAKKMRRMLSNRESARRSRKRKQTHLDNLESQVSRLTAENASLLKRLADMTQKYTDATLDNRHLIADVEMMRRKVHVADEAVRRVTGASMPLASDAPSVAVAVQESMQHVLQAPVHGNQIKPDLPNATIPLKCGEMVTMAVSLRRVASLENLQKRFHKDSVHSATALPLSDPEALNGDK